MAGSAGAATAGAQAGPEASLAPSGGDAPPAAAADGGVGSEPPALLLRAAELAQAQGDRGTARALLDLALAAIARTQAGPVPLRVVLATGARDPDFAEQDFVDAAIAPSGERAALAHGRLLSVVELDGGYELRRLAAYPERLRRVVSDRSGKRLLTLAEDGIARVVQTQGEPGPCWPLQLPQDAAQPGKPGSEAVYRAPFVDFSPDGRLVFLADCGDQAAVGCPLRRLRVMAADSGRLLQTFAAAAELLDYTADREGKVALLRTGEPPRLYTASTGSELGFASLLPGAAAQACLGEPRRPAAGERPWLVSPDRRWLATVAAKAVLCLWSLAERRLAAAVTLPPELPPRGLRLESLVGDRRTITLILGSGERGSGRRGYVIDPQTGQRIAELKGLAAVLPLDDGGALLTRELGSAAAFLHPTTTSGVRPAGKDPAGGSAAGALRRGVQIFRLYPDRRLVGTPGLPRPALSCLFPFPDAVQGDGGRALFSPTAAAASADCTPVVVELSVAPPRQRRLALPVRLPLVTADFIDEQRLVIIDGAGLQVLRDTRVEYASPRVPAAITELHFSTAAQDTQLLIETADRQRRTLWMATGQLRLAPAEATGSEPAANSRPPSVQSPDRQLGAEVSASGRAAPGAGSVVAVRERASGKLRWQSALSGLPAVGALAFSPDGRFLLAGGGGTLIWLRAADGRELLRLQLVTGGAVVLAPDGRFDTLGEVARLSDYVSCHAGSYPIPFALCAQRLRTPGTLHAALAPD